ncbi:MAG: hypothetical protein QMD13_09385 [Candidatus Bathyarchaeia archaeon]|nr:hypothetical protein [Candidatus Bathyarchaeia archaeon]
MSKEINVKGMYVWIPYDLWKKFDVVCHEEGCKKALRIATLIEDYVSTREDIINEWRTKERRSSPIPARVEPDTKPEESEE